MPFLLVNIKAAVIQQDIVISAAQDSREFVSLWKHLFYLSCSRFKGAWLGSLSVDQPVCYGIHCVSCIIFYMFLSTVS